MVGSEQVGQEPIFDLFLIFSIVYELFLHSLFLPHHSDHYSHHHDGDEDQSVQTVDVAGEDRRQQDAGLHWVAGVRVGAVGFQAGLPLLVVGDVGYRFGVPHAGQGERHQYVVAQFSQGIQEHGSADEGEGEAELQRKGEDYLVGGFHVGEDQPDGEATTDIEDVSFVEGEVFPLLQQAQFVLAAGHHDVLDPEEQEKRGVPEQVGLAFSGGDHGRVADEGVGDGLIMDEEDVGQEEEKDLHDHEDEHDDSFEGRNQYAVLAFHFYNQYLKSVGLIYKYHHIIEGFRLLFLILVLARTSSP